MWSTYILCLLVGLAAATTDYAWKSDTEYQYQVRGLTLTSLHQVDNQYSGIVIRAHLTVRPRTPGLLYAKLTDTQYAQVHAKLPRGWRSEIPDSQLTFRPMQLTNKPFEIQMKNGTVQELIVDKSIPNWEANIIKSIVSQIQVDVQGENLIKSRYNQPNEEQSENISAEFKTMEDTVTGKCETLYDITELPEYILQSKPELAPLSHLKGDGRFIEVVKTRNYSNCDERIVYHYGLGEMEGMEPASSKMGDMFVKSSVSRVILSGTLKRHTIQSSVTVNKILVKPTPNANQQGLVVSQLNITLIRVDAASGQPQELQQRQTLGNLVYRYNSPYATHNAAREGIRNSQEHLYAKESSESSSSSSEEQRQRRHPRSLDTQQLREKYGRYDDSSSSSSSSSSEESVEQQWQQDKPQLSQPADTPMLPYTIGYQGRSIKTAQNINIVQEVQKLAKQIGQELQQPSLIPKHDTLAKFTVLYNLLRTMNYQELQEASRDLYNMKNKQDREQTDVWRVYRDAVAQAGTGPALLIIKDWIQGMKIRGFTAASVIATMAHSVRTPTEEYMRTFYTLVTDNKVLHEEFLNDTAILSFADLVRRVYVNKQESHDQYPVHTFGKFYKQNNEVVEQEYIPYLAKQLKQAIHEADSHKIQVYIRALGNIGHRQILEVFEPYLEGQKQISQFQRLLMVVSMDQLVKVSPKTARSVLYKIYQNEGEVDVIRVAAVHQLMRTVPPVSMLQRMAQYTNVDSSRNVRSAVKSAIQSAAQLKHHAHSELAQNAQAAEFLLNPKIYGMQYSKQYLKEYVVEEMNLVYKKHASYLSGEDNVIPQGIMYSFYGNMDGLKRQYMNLQAIVSSVEDLERVFEDQTEQRKEETITGAKQQSEWAADHIARLLKIKWEEREQLEGNVHFGMGGVSRFYTIDNRTIEQLPEYLKKLTEDLKKGKEFNITKFYNPYEMTLAFPTAMGLPFVYTLETPILLSLHGEIRYISHPEIVNSGKIQIPETVNMTSDIRAVISFKTQAKLGFVTPFDHQHYVAGYDKKMQLNVPLRTQVDIDLKNKEIRANFQPLDDQNEEIFHYSTWPYTAKHDILELKPVSRIASAEIVHIRKPHGFEYEFGKKNGMAFRLRGETEQKFIDFKWLYENARKHQGLSYIMTPFTEDSLVYSQFNMEYDNKLSHAKSMQFQFGWEKTYYSGKHESKEVQPEFNEVFNKIHGLKESEDRQRYLMEKAAVGINSVDARVYDFSVQFLGKEQHKYNVTLAVATSAVDEKSRVLFYYKKDAFDNKEYEVAFYTENKVPNTNGLDFIYALKFDPKITSQMKLAWGEKLQQGSHVELKAHLEKNEERKEYLQSHPMAKLCNEQMKKGDQQLYACRNMTALANLLNYYTMDIKYQNISPEVRNWTYKAYSAARCLGSLYMDENIFEGHGHADEIKIQTVFEPRLQSVNVTLRTEKMQTEFNNIRMNDWGKALFVIHPVFSVDRRLAGLAQNEVYQPTCVVDQKYVESFNNKTYPIELGKTWHVQMEYRVPYAARLQSQNQKQQSRFQNQYEYDYVVLVRDSGNNKKDVKLVLNNEKNYFEIDMIPSDGSSHSGSQPAGKVMINQQQIHFDDKYSHDVGKYVQVYALPNGDVKIEVNRDFYIIYDGERIKLTTIRSNLFRGEVRGLCGTFNGEKTTDFLTPKNCIVRQPQDFVATWAIIDASAQGPAKERQVRAQQAHCVEKMQIYANVISPRDYKERRGENQVEGGNQQHHHASHTSCSKQQTQVVEEDGGETLCFTVRPLPTCRVTCKAVNMIVKTVEVHCVKRSNVSELWQKQIQKGASPDFSHKPATKTIKIKVAQSCSP